MFDATPYMAERERLYEMRRQTKARGLVRQALAVRGGTPGLVERVVNWLLDVTPPRPEPDTAQPAAPQPAPAAAPETTASHLAAR